MKRAEIFLAALGCFLWVGGCSGSSGAGDGGDGDGGDGADIDPCAAARPAWEQTWRISLENTGLAGRTPQINVMDVWGTAANDIYAVGFAGNIVHYDGQRWQKMESGTDENLEGVWGYVLTDDQGKETRREVFAVGHNGTILRYDGTAWQPARVINDPDPARPDPQVVTGNFHDVWGIAAPGPNPNQQPTVIAVGAEGLIVRWEPLRGEFLEMRKREEFSYPCDAGTCTRISFLRYSPERLGGVFGTSANFFVAVGNNGTILEYDGSTWTRRVIIDFNTHLNGVWGRGAGEIFAVGLEGVILRRSGNGTWEFLRDLAQAAGGYLDLGPVYLRGLWAFYQSKCGPVPDGGTERPDTSWAIFVGWDSRLYLFHDRIVCPFGQLGIDRLESVWGTAPRPEAERTLPDGGVLCDPVEAFVGGVNGTVVRLTNPKGQ